MRQISPLIGPAVFCLCQTGGDVAQLPDLRILAELTYQNIIYFETEARLNNIKNLVPYLKENAFRVFLTVLCGTRLHFRISKTYFATERKS